MILCVFRANAPKIRRIVRCSETRTLMPLLSAYEDFVNRTLAAVQGTWAKLTFVAELKGQSSEYQHWGLEYTHGSDRAKQAMQQAHTEILERVLQTPLARLEEDAKAAKPSDLVESAAERLLPLDADRSSKEHLRYVLMALSFLAESRSTRQAA